jgi:hypothetical protein
MTLIVTVNVSDGKGQPKVYAMRETAEAVEKKNGGFSLAHFQPEEGNKVIQGFSKLYLDTEALKEKPAKK